MPGNPQSQQPRLRLTGYACSASSPPLLLAYLPLGAVTVVMGPNDSGKSTLLRSLDRDLHGGHFTGDREADRGTGGIFYAEVSATELDRLIRETAGGNERSSVNARDRGARPPFDEGLWHLGLSAEQLNDDPIGSAIAALQGPAEDRSRAEILAELAKSQLVGFECAGRDSNGARLWNVYWCLPPATDVTEPTRAALPSSGLWPHAQVVDSGEKRAFNRSMYAGLYGAPRHLRVPDAPIAVVALGTTSRTSMPRSVAAPTSFEVLQRAARDAATLLTNTMLHAQQDAQSDGEPLLPEEIAQREAPRAWLADLDGGAVALSDEARGAFAFLSLATNRRLPEFLSSRYSIRVAVEDIAKWFANDPLSLLVVARRDAALVEEFQIDEAAEGFRLWLQIALLAALDDGDRINRLLAGHAEDQAYAAMDVQNSRGEDEDALEAMESAQQWFADGVTSLIELDDSDGWVNQDLANATENIYSTTSSGRSPQPGRLFVIDEPERHLHPRLQRHAADWVAGIAASTGSPFVLATHSAAFLNLPPSHATYVSITRSEGETALQVFDPGQLTALSDFSAEMGYDRGELVAAVALWLIVEGVTDKAVLEALYGRQLRESGIAVVPIHGIAKWQVLLESDALWRFTSAPVALMHDSLSADLIDDLKAKDGVELTALEKDGTQPEELRLAAKLIRGLGDRGRSLALVPNEDADVFAGLADEAIKQIFPKYPGHQDAEAAWARHQKGSHDAFLRSRYDVEKAAEKFEEIALKMVELGLSSASLERAVAFCGELVNGSVLGELEPAQGLSPEEFEGQPGDTRQPLDDGR